MTVCTWRKKELIDFTLTEYLVRKLLHFLGNFIAHRYSYVASTRLSLHHQFHTEMRMFCRNLAKLQSATEQEEEPPPSLHHGSRMLGGLMLRMKIFLVLFNVFITFVTNKNIDANRQSSVLLMYRSRWEQKFP